MIFDFTDIKQLIVIIAIVLFSALILISELFLGYKCSDGILALLNMMIGALIAILSGKAISMGSDGA